MPCWSIQQNNPSMDKMIGERLELFKKALVGLGYYINPAGYMDFDASADCMAQQTSVTVKRGVVSVHLSNASTISMEEAVNQVKRAYSAQVVQAALQRFGWQQTAPLKDGRLTARRRY